MAALLTLPGLPGKDASDALAQVFKTLTDAGIAVLAKGCPPKDPRIIIEW